MTLNTSTLLLDAKLRRPQVRGSIVARRRLYQILDRGLEHPLTLVCGSAGFGKTTLVSAWIGTIAEQRATAPIPNVCWLSLDESDSDLGQFMRYFIAAVRTVTPNACPETSGLLDRGLDVPIPELYRVFSNDLERLPRKIIVVLDDYHLIKGRAVHDLLTELFQHWPKSLHLILLARFVPPLPLATLRARNEIAEIRNHDLRFVREELAAYFRLRTPKPLSQRSLDLIEQKAEGWAVGLQLLSMSMADANDIEAFVEAFAGTNADVAEYLFQEVLMQQPPAVQAFLLATSILDRFCTELCQTLAPNDDPDWNASAVINHLMQENLFTVMLDDRGEWYRYHALFQDYLLRVFATAAGQEKIVDLRQRAATWHESHGFMDEAVRYAARAGDLKLAAQMMERGLRDVLNREDRLTLERWLHMLPEDFIRSRPGLLMIKAWALNFAGQISAIPYVLQDVESHGDQFVPTEEDQERHQARLGQIAALKTVITFFAGETDLSITLGRQALANLPLSWTYVRGGLMDYLALSMQATGQGDAFEHELWTAYERQHDQASPYALRLLLALCLRNLQTGQLLEAERGATAMMQQSTLSDLAVLRGWAHFVLGLVHYQWDHLDIARRHFDAPVAHWYQMQSLVSQHSAAGLVSVHLAMGRLAEAEQIVDFLCQQDLQRRGRLGPVAQSLQARLWLARGQVDDAVVWATTYSKPDGLIFMQLLELPQLTRMKAVLAGGTRADALRALQIVDDLYAYAEETHNTRRTIEALAARALIMDILDDEEAARADLLLAVQLAHPGRFIRPFSDLGPRMRVLLVTLSAPEQLADYVRQIVAAFAAQSTGQPPVSLQVGSQAASSAPPTPVQQPLIEPLTRRELDVLTLLREPLAIKEIAQRLDISYATTKRHSVNLYGKLGVNSRWDAVAKAQEFGILNAR